MNSQRSAGGGPNEAPLTNSWRDWFEHASGPQRAFALDLAKQQGVLLFRDLPAVPRNGARPAPAPDPGQSPALATLLSEEDPGAVSLSPLLTDFADADLDGNQRAAVHSALQTPDVCMIEGLPGSGKSRVAAEIFEQAIRRNWRCLLLAPTPDGLSPVLQRLAANPCALPIRLLDPAEEVAALPAWLQALTLGEQQKSFRAKTQSQAQQYRAEAELACARRRHQDTVWSHLRQQAQRRLALEQRQAALTARLASIEAEVRGEAAGLPEGGSGMVSGPFTSEWLQLAKGHATRGAELDRAIEQGGADKADADRKLNELDLELAEVEPFAQARLHRRVFRPAFWQSFFKGPVLKRREALIAERQRLGAEAARLEAALAAQGQARLQLDAGFQAECEALFQAEVARRRQELLAQHRHLDGEIHEIDELFREQADGLEEDHRPAGPQSAALDQAHARWLQCKASDDEASRLAHQWSQYLDRSGHELAARLPAMANVLAATLQGLQGQPLVTEGNFDLVLVEDAEGLAEVDLHVAARLGKRLVLLGLQSGETDAREEAAGVVQGLRALHASTWTKLWKRLGGGARRSRFAWRAEGERRVCQLLPIAPDDRRYLDAETLADATEIELRILHRPGQKPCLAEVVFPGHMAFSEAFCHIVHELEEFPHAATGDAPIWTDGDVIGCQLAPQPAAAQSCELAPGVEAQFSANGQEGALASLAFSREQFWTPEKAQEWMREKLPEVSSLRCVRLPTCHRCREPLRSQVATILFDAPTFPAVGEANAGLQLVAVPPLRRPEVPRDGAGLELDLSAPRHADRIPTEYRMGLPSHGVVNYLEAQALVRHLEQNPPSAGEHYALMALQLPQVEVLRRVLAKSTFLKGVANQLTLGTPEQLRHVECDAAFLSFVRSHTHRAVPFAADPQSLVLALTRARRRVFLFADLGSLGKRAQRAGPLDHQDARAAQLEQRRLARLVHFLAGSLQAPPLPAKLAVASSHHA